VTMDKNPGVMKAIRKLKAFDWKTMYGRYKDDCDKQWGNERVCGEQRLPGEGY